MNFGAFERDEKEFKPKWIIMNYKNIITSTYIINLFMFNKGLSAKTKSNFWAIPQKSQSLWLRVKVHSQSDFLEKFLY
jgi:hypothetical protein